MSVEKKSLINNMTTTKKAIIATSKPVAPVVSGKISSKVSAKSLGKRVSNKLIASKALNKAVW